MERSTTSRKSFLKTAPKVGLIMTTALASIALATAPASAAPSAEKSFSRAQAALAKGQTDKAITYAEAAVLAEPRNPGFRALLGAAYLEAGRFEAAVTSFNDALELGDTEPRTSLSYALAAIAMGDSESAIAALEEREASISPADFGLAMALAGEPDKGVHILTNALRAGDDSAKMRQNLAYSYALAGNWRAARLMAAQDVPADQLDARLTDWAVTSKPEDVMKRVANLLGVTPSAGGQPAQLALANFPAQVAVVAEAEPQVETMPARELGDADLAEVVPSQTETLAFGMGRDESSTDEIETVDPTIATIMRATQPTRATEPVVATNTQAAPAPAGPRFVSKPVVQTLPSRPEPQRAAPRSVERVASRTPVAPTQTVNYKGTTHLVQLGSYNSRAEAKAGWAAMQRRFSQLASHDVVITKAKVKGNIYYRVAAAGFNSSGARSMCGTVKSSGRSCFAYAASNPPKGAIDDGTRIAARGR